MAAHSRDHPSSQTGGGLQRTDPTGLVDLACPDQVLRATSSILARHYDTPYAADALARAFADVARCFRGDYPGLLRCDTHYHDLRHALDTGLAMARLLDGYALADSPGPAIDAEHALLGILLALYHDIGLLRRPDEAHLNGASLTPVHERRGVGFMSAYLAHTPVAHLATKAELIMVTRLDYAMQADWSPPDRVLASLLGTADLLSQLADRCYLEKCREFLFMEFSAIGLAGRDNSPYPDPETLLRKTPEFYTGLLRKRIHNEYHDADRYMACHFGGQCPYTAAIERNFGYLQRLLDKGDFTSLRRRPQRIIEAL